MFRVVCIGWLPGGNTFLFRFEVVEEIVIKFMLEFYTYCIIVQYGDDDDYIGLVEMLKSIIYIRWKAWIIILYALMLFLLSFYEAFKEYTF